MCNKLEHGKIYGLILLIVGLVFILLNILVVYPYLNCFFAPLTFWLLAGIGVVGGILLFFNINLSYTGED